VIPPVGEGDPLPVCAGQTSEAANGVSPEIKWTDQLADELHKPVRRHFPKRKVWARGIDQIWAVDLIDMQHYAKYNDGYKYLLV
jgi:hypothetical protein